MKNSMAALITDFEGFKKSRRTKATDIPTLDKFIREARTMETLLGKADAEFQKAQSGDASALKAGKKHLEQFRQICRRRFPD